LASAQTERTPIDLLAGDELQSFAGVEVESEATDSTAATAGRNAFDLMMARASSAPTAVPLRGGGLSGSSAFDVMMKSSRTVAVIGAAKRQRGGQSGWRGGGGSYNRGGSSGPGRRRTPRCPEFKRIKGTSPPFIVDGFPFASKELSSIYFLTHFHSDHYGGITKVGWSLSLSTHERQLLSV
jgi:hypothetical protein